MKIKKSTIIRTIILVHALVNEILRARGIETIKIENETITELISQVYLILAVILAWWKNNSFTKEALEADKVLERKRRAK